ncbi:MAG: heme biosynthesis protein HemY [Alphaproteobacteria bacterium]|nr:heme biosynthesis protein HemY [Alphaproteobacteria bacterium]
MLRLILFLAFIIALASGLAWLADRPGLIVVNWEGYQAEIQVFHAVVALALITGLALVTWSLLRHLWESPATIGSYFNKRRQKRGLDALSSGMIAIGAGDRSTATRYAIQARKSMPNEPLTHLLRAQAAQLSGDQATARRIYESMLAAPDTEQLGLRGLFLEAQREGETEAATQFAQRAVGLNPKLSWPVEALFDLQCKDHSWEGALETLAVARKNGHVEKASADRRRAVLLTAQAQELEDKDPERALNLAMDAHNLAADLVPAAAIAGRLLASRGSTPKATKILQKTWQKSPHPDLATAFAYARLGDSPRDRLERVKKLAGLNPHALESSIALANAAIEAKEFDVARGALEPLIDNRLTQRACTLMARVEGEQHGDKGAVREWLARAVNAPRDPAWTADGIVSEHWAAVSPVTGALDAFQWRVPVESMEKTADEIVARKLEELVALGAPLEVGAKDVTPDQASRNADAAHSGGAKPAAAKPVAKDVVDADVVDVAKPVTAKTEGAADVAAKSNAVPSQQEKKKDESNLAKSTEPQAEAKAAAKTETKSGMKTETKTDRKSETKSETKSGATEISPATSEASTHEKASEAARGQREDAGRRTSQSDAGIGSKSVAGEAQVMISKAESGAEPAVAAKHRTRDGGAIPEGGLVPMGRAAVDLSSGKAVPSQVKTEKPAPAEKPAGAQEATVALEKSEDVKSPESAKSTGDASDASGPEKPQAAKSDNLSGEGETSKPAPRKGKRAKKTKRGGAASEPLIFVSPRPPDDPGPEADAPSDVPKGPPKPYRIHS